MKGNSTIPGAIAAFVRHEMMMRPKERYYRM